MSVKEERLDTSHGPVIVEAWENVTEFSHPESPLPLVVYVNFADGSHIRATKGDGVYIIGNPKALEHTEHPSRAAEFMDDWQDLTELEMEFPDDLEKVVETVKSFLGIDNSPWHRRRVRPLEKTHDGIAKRLSRRQYKE